MKKKINFKLITRIHANVFIHGEQRKRKICVERKVHSYTGHAHLKPLAVFYGV